MKNAAVIYCRVSTKDQVDRFSLETQQKACRDWCRANHLEVEQVMIEEGESAKTSDRPVFQKLLDYCQAHSSRIRAFVVFTGSRFARNTRDQLNIQHQLAQIGIRLFSVTEPTEDTPMGRAMIKFSAVMSELENEQKAEVTTAGMKTALDRGHWTFMAPIGYLNRRDDSGRAIVVPDPDKATLIRRAFELFATAEYSQHRLLLQLRTEGYRSLHGHQLTAQTLNNILRNPFYVGSLRVPAWKKLEKGTHEPLVKQTTFDFVQRLIAEGQGNQGPRTKDHEDFPLRCFVHCPGCGMGLTGGWSKGKRHKYAYYRCLKNHLNIPKHTLEAKFKDFLEEVRIERPWVDLFRAVVEKVFNQMNQRAEDHGRENQEQIRRLKEQREDLLDLYLEKKAIDREALAGRLKRLTEELDQLEDQARDSKVKYQVDINRLTKDAEIVMVRPDQFWNDADLEGKLLLQSLLFPEGVIFTAKGFKAEKKTVFLEVVADLRNANPSEVFNLAPRGATRFDGIEHPGNLQILISSLQGLQAFRKHFKKTVQA